MLRYYTDIINKYSRVYRGISYNYCEAYFVPINVAMLLLARALLQGYCRKSDSQPGVRVVTVAFVRTHAVCIVYTAGENIYTM